MKEERKGASKRHLRTAFDVLCKTRYGLVIAPVLSLPMHSLHHPSLQTLMAGDREL